MADLDGGARYGIRKGIILYLADWFTPEKIEAVEDILSRFLDMTGETFTKKCSGRLDAYPGTGCPSGFRNIRGGWQKIFRREFDGQFQPVPSQGSSPCPTATASTCRPSTAFSPSLISSTG